MAVEDDIRRDDDEGIITLTFTRDKKLNSVTDAMVGVLNHALTDLRDDESQRALVVQAEGRYFTAGKDISEFTIQPESGVAMRRNYRNLTDVFDELERIEKPTILAVQGPCLGVGVEFGSSFDFRFATPRAAIALPEMPNLAILPGSGGISRLTRLVGPHWARWIALAGETVGAEQGVTIGWFHQVLPEEGFHEAVHAWTRKLVSFSAEALGLGKIGIDLAVNADPRLSRQFDWVANTNLNTTREYLAKLEEFQNRMKK